MPHARDVSRAAGICRAFRVLAHVRPTGKDRDGALLKGITLGPDGTVLDKNGEFRLPTLVEAKRPVSC